MLQNTATARLSLAVEESRVYVQKRFRKGLEAGRIEIDSFIKTREKRLLYLVLSFILFVFGVWIVFGVVDGTDRRPIGDAFD